MTNEDIESIIETHLAGSKAHVTGDGSKFEATVISNEFDGLSMVKKHQLIYKLLNDQISSGAIHALSIKAFTENEWAAQS
ncbi:MAG TPA: BolA family transcriptional regulator [Gammaproteobacteria bacterium]|nr:BolA family transcriptional regulator [Gammaproteobacteria bacterium]